MVQAVHSSIQMPILRCKMLVGDTPNPFTLHRSDAGCAFLRNASVACQCTLSLKIPNAFWCKRQWRSSGIRGRMSALCA